METRNLALFFLAASCLHCSKASPPGPSSDPGLAPSASQAVTPGAPAADASIVVTRAHRPGQRYEVMYKSVLSGAVPMSTEMHGEAKVTSVTPAGTEFRLHIATITQNGRPAASDRDVTVRVKPRAADVTASPPEVAAYLTPIEMLMGMSLCRPPAEAMKAGEAKTTALSGGSQTVALKSVSVAGSAVFASFEEAFTPADGGQDPFEGASSTSFRVSLDDGFEGDCHASSTRMVGGSPDVTAYDFHVKRLPDAAK